MTLPTLRRGAPWSIFDSFDSGIRAAEINHETRRNEILHITNRAPDWALNRSRSKAGYDITDMERYAMVLRLRPEFEQEYMKYHKAVWPEVLELIRDCNVRNYSIFIHDHQLFAYYEYVGLDFKADMAKMAAHPKMIEWWEIMQPMQEPVVSAQPGEWWVRIVEAFHTD